MNEAFHPDFVKGLADGLENKINSLYPLIRSIEVFRYELQKNEKSGIE